ncbi:molybdenum ABC transporter substrate-binding protein [Pantoea rodasii]|uniref:Molybdenum ABC transporter substrate-binding protein n=1 Tax=Pantoea rodasii TaxID=1076549 RepID=A0A2M9W6Y9_9GAMM|nr:substrate-binding domain-containing protein [Pantoea rodasii]PJZ03301.1 molybdenum ABC transporter substrate-binding protein [Pantoea rodasii]
MTTLRLLAAGSLRSVWPPLMAAFSAQSGLRTETDFGPAGLLRQRIEQGENCDLFASANLQHPAKLVQQRIAMNMGRFAANALCLTVKRDVVTNSDNWLSLLLRDDLRLATSTPLCDPSGDYTWQLFNNIELAHPGCGEKLKQKARTLVGGPDSLPLPAGELAARWLIDHQHTEMFIGYASYAPRLVCHSQLQVFAIPDPFNVQAEYGWATLTPAAEPLATFLHSASAQTLLKQHGFT